MKIKNLGGVFEFTLPSNTYTCAADTIYKAKASFFDFLEEKIDKEITNQMLKFGKPDNFIADLNCFSNGGSEYVEKFDLVTANTSEFNLTRDKIYVVKDVNSLSTITVTDDKGNEEIFTVEYFNKYCDDK